MFEVTWKSNERGSAMSEWTTETDDSDPIQTGTVSLDERVDKVLVRAEMSRCGWLGDIRWSRWRLPGHWMCV